MSPKKILTNKYSSILAVLLSLMVPTLALAEKVTAPEFRLFTISATCKATDVLSCWIASVFAWSQAAILLLATVVLVVAGIMYMTSAGNTKQIELSKKMIFGALSGVAVIVLGKFFLQFVVGVPWVN